MNKKEMNFLEHYDKEKYEKPSVAVDLVLFTIDDGELKTLMIKRTNYPFKDALALPGVFVGIDEDLDHAAARGLKQKTGLENIYFEQLYTWGQVDRDPRMRIISVSYYALVPWEKISQSSDISENAEFYSTEKIINQIENIAFDHKKIIAAGRDRIRNKIEYTNIAFQLVPKEFTLPQLQKIYEIILGKKLYKANFRKKISDKIQETEKMTSGDAHRPSKFYILKP